MRSERILGSNIKLLLNERGVSTEEFAESLGYSFFDVQKLCDARLFTTEDDIKDIANYFNVAVEDLYFDQGDSKYTGEGFIHCIGQFKSYENKQKVLDIFDMYCDLKESLEINK